MLKKLEIVHVSHRAKSEDGILGSKKGRKSGNGRKSGTRKPKVRKHRRTKGRSFEEAE